MLNTQLVSGLICFHSHDGDPTTCRYLASPQEQLSVGDTLDYSQSQVSRFVDSFVEALVKLRSDVIKFPDSLDKLSTTIDKFFMVAGFPNVIACVDGSLIPMMKPSECPVEYFGRKSRYCLNIQVAALPDYSFSSLNAQLPGSCHDNYVFYCSSLRRVLNSLPPQFPGVVLGDSGYVGCASQRVFIPFRMTNSDDKVLFNNTDTSDSEYCGQQHRRKSNRLLFWYHTLVNSIEFAIVP